MLQVFSPRLLIVFWYFLIMTFFFTMQTFLFFFSQNLSIIFFFFCIWNLNQKSFPLCSVVVEYILFFFSSPCVVPLFKFLAYLEFILCMMDGMD